MAWEAGFLLIMASLTAFVGSIGLTGTMGMNVLERTREIGVMRSIGASDGAVQRIRKRSEYLYPVAP